MERFRAWWPVLWALGGAIIATTTSLVVNAEKVEQLERRVDELHTEQLQIQQIAVQVGRADERTQAIQQMQQSQQKLLELILERVE